MRRLIPEVEVLTVKPEANAPGLDLEKIFTYHPPNIDQAERYERIRNAARLFAEEIIGLSPESRERTHAINKVQEAVFWANAAIARNE